MATHLDGSNPWIAPRSCISSMLQLPRRLLFAPHRWRPRGSSPSLPVLPFKPSQTCTQRDEPGRITNYDAQSPQTWSCFCRIMRASGSSNYAYKQFMHFLSHCENLITRQTHKTNRGSESKRDLSPSKGPCRFYSPPSRRLCIPARGASARHDPVSLLSPPFLQSPPVHPIPASSLARKRVTKFTEKHRRRGV